MPMMRNMYSGVVMDVADDDVPERQGQGYVVISTDYTIPSLVVQAPIESLEAALEAAAAVTGDNPVLPHIQALVDEHAAWTAKDAAAQVADLQDILEKTKPKPRKAAVKKAAKKDA